MGLLDHLDELRKRIIRSLIGLVIAFLGCWAFSREIYQFLALPIYKLLPEGSKIVYTGVTDPFMVYVKVAGLAAIFIAAPIWLYQVWGFIAPGLYKSERRYAAPFIVFGSMFFIGGGAFGYYIAFPFAAAFLLGVGQDFEPMLTVERYFGFLMTVLLGLGVMFELPILIFILSEIGIVTPRFLLRNFRWAVLIIFIVAALITPTPDVVNLCLFALPTIALYLLGIAAAALVGWRRNRRKAIPEQL